MNEWITDTTYLIFLFHELTSSLHMLTLYQPFVAAGSAYDSLNLSDLHYITQIINFSG